MQISSGWAKGMRLMTPRGDGTRPTAAKVRAAALNMLMPVLPGSRFLDLFAGSGGMGLEAVSRGASAAFFVDKAPPALAALRQNVAELTRRAQAQGLTVPHLSVHLGSLPQALADLNSPHLNSPHFHGVFDVAFVDPPYREVPMLVPLILTKLLPLMAPAGIVLFECAKCDGPHVAAAPAGWTLTKQRAYGESLLTMLEKS